MDDLTFINQLYRRMQAVNPGIAEMEDFEFGYGLESLTPSSGWASIQPLSQAEIERKVHDLAFYTSIQLRPKRNGKPVMDAQVRELTQVLFAGLVAGTYDPDWIHQHFTFDIRGFYFITKTQYYTNEIIERMGGSPYRQFEPLQRRFEGAHAIGYKEFKQSNAEVDQCFLDLVLRLVEIKGAPIVIAIAGQTAAGKTEITERLTERFQASGNQVTTLEIDNFLLDRDYREARGIDSLGKEALHFERFKICLRDLCQGKRVEIPRYDFISALSSHDLEGSLKPGWQSLIVEPADIVFMEGNFPFLYPEIATLIGVKVVYLTADDVRLKRKWKRDMDYRKKYELTYFLNRYFREQFIMAEQVYRPQMALCDLIVDTTEATIWALPEIQEMLTSVKK